MTNPKVEELYNQQYQEVAIMVTQAKEHLAALEKQLINAYSQTTQYRLEQEQRQLREEYYNEDHLNNPVKTKEDGLRFKYTLV